MKFADILSMLFWALVVTLGFQWFFGSKQESTAQRTLAGQRFSAPSAEEASFYKPLNLEIDFTDQVSKDRSVTTVIKANRARYTFSTEGASLEMLEFKRNWGGKESYLATVFPPAYRDKEKRAFLVAFDKQTPYSYRLIEHKEIDDKHVLRYEADFENGTIEKEFSIHKDAPQIDLVIKISNKNGELVAPRLIFPSPIVAELGAKDATFAIISDASNKLTVEPKGQSTFASYWVKPTIVGTQDRYFLHALVGDENNFVQRSYFKSVDLDSMYTFLEGQPTAAGEWKLSFYFGPKEYSAIMKINPNLEQVLNYGWLGFISRPASHFLLGALNKIYDYTNSYGLAIILLVILMRLLLIPLSFSAEKGAKKAAEVEKKMRHLEQKHKNDKEALLKAKAELIKQHGVPGLGTLLPLLLQIPLFLALSWVLSNAVELYKAPFLWIPDLSSADPYYILPILLVLGMLLQALTMPSSQRISFVIAAFIVATFAINLSAGLALYIFVSTIVGVAATRIMRILRPA